MNLLKIGWAEEFGILINNHSELHKSLIYYHRLCKFIQFLNGLPCTCLKACVLYILRVGITDQMSEATQSGFLVVLSKQVFHSYPFYLYLLSACILHSDDLMLLGLQLQSPDATPSMRVAALRTLSYALKTLGEVKHTFRSLHIFA